ncbi:MAG: glycosyltransferase family 1 protein, partial [Actinomycetota bacterium]|nr:glycosyltransferase family 1 protein [Actinomycetota bacterium]
PVALAAALRRLLDDPGERAQLAAGARRAAAGPYSWDAIAASHLELYESLAEATGGGARMPA